MALVVDLVTAVLILGMTYALASEGLWGAALMFFNVVFSGIIAFNFYEPLAKLLDGTGIGWGFSDTLCLLAVFLVALVILRLTTESIAPAMVRFPAPVYHIGRWLFALGGGAATIGILLLAFETAPVNKKIFGVIDYKSKVPFGLGLERQWLGFFQYTTGQVFAAHEPGQRDPFKEYGTAKVFDPRGEWLLIHQQARPYGTETVLEEGGAGAAAGEGGAAGAGANAPGGNAGGGNGANANPNAGGNPNDPKVVGPAVGGGVVIPGQ